MDTTRAKNIIQWFFIFLLVLLLIVGILKLLKRGKPAALPAKKNPGSVIQKVTPLAEATGELKMAVSGTSAVVSADEEIPVRIIGSSGGSQVVGYDVVLSYDPAMLSYRSTDHPLGNDYSSSVRTTGSTLTVSGIVRKEAAAPRIFENTVMETVRFKPLRMGKTTVAFVFRPHMTDESNLITGDSRDILGKASPLVLTIGKPLRLNLQETRQIEGTAFSLRLDRISVPSASCRDCFTSQDLTLINTSNNSQFAFGFRSGGFAGTIHDETRVDGYLFKLNNSTGTSVTVLVAPE